MIKITSQNPFEEIIIERCPNLKAVGLGSEQCSMIRLVDCISLEHLSLSSTNYTLENCPEIESLYLSYAAQDVLNMEEFPNLKTLYVQDCLAETILIENLSQLNTLYISDKKLQLLQTFDNDIKLNNEKRGSTKLIYNACLIITN